ncbi:glycosyl transferase [Ochrobactrum sp. MYb15]|uniref:glycosyl transferase n=1 Tax=Brucella pituitosa TaxID=571256 RepID=UPI000CFD94C5|nr:glycosyl transferase [Ochrobactrum sp. MYb19]PRA54452.1 glycosyl transferase [Ochrobactrum sp. MYb68]PRA64373.1 glycosyl transferase [Ochrobactrum sp. MYb18]PRA75117.1 glycosyl transferase [Brucella thiophenivorans]PRA89671.1 glycosyl transferase [Ochrobactrum sp. MYb14]PRA96701.1 glycosyl transferase [Ochrobactrum sp. MYb15]
MDILTVCIVIYKPNVSELYNTLSSLQRAVKNIEISVETRILIVDNSPDASIDRDFHPVFLEISTRLIHGHGNIGFARANNLIFNGDVGSFHLVLNPDVELSPLALKIALSFMLENSECGLLSPAAIYPNGKKQYLCKRYPSLYNLLLRGFAPRFISKLFQKQLDRYEMREETNSNVYWNPPIVSGCFMFFRGNVFRMIRGFDERYMLYFEDFDITIRTRRIALIAYVPDVQIIHSGGDAAKKGWWHIKQFGLSAILFFRTHGIKLF